MFTLKLYRSRNGQLVTKFLTVDHVTSMTIGENKRTLEIWAHMTPQGGDCQPIFVGAHEPQMDGVPAEEFWGWGLLENAQGKTTEHFRPSSYGHLG